jgi:predicted phage terminase large subunit-like protein
MSSTTERVRTLEPKAVRMREALRNPYDIIRELNNRSLYHFLQYFWPVLTTHDFSPNWHIEYLCEQLEKVAERVANKLPREHDLIINVPPGSTKTVTVSIVFPVWCWSKWHWMKFINASYSAQLALEGADYCRDLVNSTEFRTVYPEIEIRDDKNTKSNFRIIKTTPSFPGRPRRVEQGGGRFSTSVGGTLIGFHGDILIVDDPINPNQAVSEVELGNANRWMEQTLSTRKTDKNITPTVLIMQRLHQDDPAGHMLAKLKENVFHICLPGECRNYADKVSPKELINYYKNGLMDPVRLPWKALDDLAADLGQYGYAGQIGQDPTPPGGGMFKTDHFVMVNKLPEPKEIINTIRYWDKAGTADGGAYTAGVRMSRLTDNRWIIEDVKRGRWSSNERERIIRETAVADGRRVEIWVEQEPGSGGKESAEGTIRNLVGFVCKAEHPTGDKIFRADPFSVQVNVGAVMILNAMWNHDFIEELRFFPYSTYKDQVDASSGAWNKLVGKKVARRIT